MRLDRLYVHDLPGRLRVRTPLLKRGNAEHVAKLLSGVAGVKRVEPNPVTGSVVIFYDENIVAGDNLLENVRRHAKLSIRAKKPHLQVSECGRRESQLSIVPRPVGDKPEIWNAMAKAGATLLLEKAVERSVLLLLAQIF
jgi:hypothetical protein